MVFSSIIFIFYFLPLLLFVYYLTGTRNAVLLFGSVIFYIWGEGTYVVLLAALVLVNYVAGLLIQRSEGNRRQTVTLIAIAIDLLVLCRFKYTPLVIQTLAAGHISGGPLSRLRSHLPLGISFFTFQLVSYLLDVNRGKIKAESNLTRLATYIMMFPHLIAGPIVRYAEIAKDLRQKTVTLERVGLGVQYFVVGLCQKVLIANTVAPVADAIFTLPKEQLGSVAAWLGIVAYTLQIYFDFCGYSNMAIGLAFLLGFHFPKNFDYPYSAKSVTEFWRRWHMTLSFWFRDYVYIPLGGNRKGNNATLRNLVIVFFLVGLWHGAAWTFVAWGLYHGLFLLIERAGWGRIVARFPRGLRVAYTLVVVMFGWVLFRAATFHQAVFFSHAMIGGGVPGPLPVPILKLLNPEVRIALVIGSILSFPVLPRLLDALGKPRVGRDEEYAEPRLDTFFVHPLPVTAMALGLIACIALLATGSLNPFLYFRF